MKKTLFLILLAGLFAGSTLCGAVRVTRAKISLGNSFKLSARSMGELEFAVENSNTSACRVMIRLRQQETYLPSGNNNSPEVYVPAKSTVVYTVPIHLDNSEKYTYEVFVNGIKQKSSVLQDCIIRLNSTQDFPIGILNNNSEQTDGFGFKKNSLRSSFYHIRSEKAPRRKELYDSMRLLLIAQPDFDSLTSEQYSAILEYAASGGTVVFADPRGTLEAARTPLKALLPVEITGIRKISDPQFFNLYSGLRPDALPREGVDFLCSVPRQDKNVIQLLRSNGYPVLTQMRYGSGTVKVLAVALSTQNFINSLPFIEKLRSEVLFVPDEEKIHNDFASALNMLTGFAVPDTALIRNILCIYLLLLAGILFWGFRKKRTSTAWALCAVCAVAGTLLILLYAQLTIGKRGSLTAVIALENTALPGEHASYLSLYSRKAQTAAVTPPEESRNISGVIPYHRNLGQLKSDPYAPVLDLHYRRDDAMEIRSLHLPVRTSRQLLVRTSPAQLSLQDEKTPPVIRVDEEGIHLLPWKVPGEQEVESAFMIFPGASRLVHVDSDRNCTLEGGSEFMTDPLLRELRKALEKSYAKTYPVLVCVSPVHSRKDVAAGKMIPDKEFMFQGKILRMYAADLQVKNNSRIRIPRELLLPARNDQSGRMLLSGNRLRSSHEFQAGNDITIKFMNPGIAHAMQLEQAELELTLSGSGDVEIRASIKLPSGKVIKGKKENDKFRFTFPKGTTPERFQDLLLTLYSSAALKTKNAADFKIKSWSILDIDLSVRARTASPREVR